MRVLVELLYSITKRGPLSTFIFHPKKILHYQKLNLCRVFPHTVMKHIMAILISVFSLGYHGKTIGFEKYSSCHRTTVAHFLNKGKWNDAKLEDIPKSTVIQLIYKEAQWSGKPVFCIVDDTISSKTKPSSRALHPIEDAYFHQPHLKGKQDYGHQAVAAMLSCNGIVLNYAVVMYDESKSKAKIVQGIADELPVPPVASYFLCDSWYTCGDIMDAFIKKGFYTIGALKTNRVLYPCGIKQKVSEFALHLRKTDAGVSFVTVGGRSYYAYRYEGSLNGIENAVVLISYPKDAFHVPKALRAFISTDVSLSTREILGRYVERWPVEVFFRQSKGRLAFGKSQIRSSEEIRRYWLLMSLAHLIACTVGGEAMPFEDGYAYIHSYIREERLRFIYQCGARHVLFEEVLALVA